MNLQRQFKTKKPVMHIYTQCKYKLGGRGEGGDSKFKEFKIHY